ncbi:hypothetical protein B0F90DRAFT_1719396 [Multifurca ochricompacta]|uniref:Zn(2)-C6 fungal-type domain-containing protein n=1 Tax=Multifurca ochricompacta TaxID=376703 RepID=A0AAD4M4K9_9AGAM|nr:hypothetical protein B0F90DRAFT_1719396 [Multifurca ochricompacta]
MDAQPQFEPTLHLKAEAASAYEFSLDMDHRKRRRNRTTQSCLNCHTSKRKCDRKRPCQRCIQLGLVITFSYGGSHPTTGNADLTFFVPLPRPVSVDDPNVDENTRFRNRIAELKPHPRWADANFCDGDPNEKWHSRASKRPPGMRIDLRRQRSSFDIGQPNTSSSHTPIKSEPGDLSQNFPYRFSPSPDSAQASPYQMFPPQNSASASYHEHAMQYGTNGNSSSDGSAGSSSYSPYLQHPGAYHSDAGADPRYRTQQGGTPGGIAVLLGLSQQLHGAIGVMRGLQEHNGHAPCVLTRRIQELGDILHQCCAEPYASGNDSVGGYESLSTPPDSDVITPLSSGEAAPIRASQLQEWHALSQAQGSAYNPYFPPVPEHPSVRVYPKDLDGHHPEFHSVM